MVSSEKGLPTTWDVAKKQNVKWVAKLGSQTFGNPVVGGGKVFVGTNNGAKRNPRADGDKGVMMCFAEPDGTFLWQAVHDTAEHDGPRLARDRNLFGALRCRRPVVLRQQSLRAGLPRCRRLLRQSERRGDSGRGVT